MGMRGARLDAVDDLERVRIELLDVVLSHHGGPEAAVAGAGDDVGGGGADAAGTFDLARLAVDLRDHVVEPVGHVNGSLVVARPVVVWVVPDAVAVGAAAERRPVDL